MAWSPSCPPKDSICLHCVPPQENPSPSLARSFEEGRMVEGRVEGGQHKKEGHEMPPHPHCLTLTVFLSVLLTPWLMGLRLLLWLLLLFRLW